MRLLFILGIFVTLYGALAFNLYELQIGKGHFYSAKAEAQNRLAGFLNASRGNIYFTDKNGNHNPAAINKEYPEIFAVPKDIKDATSTANQLAAIVNIDREQLATMLGKPQSQYALLVRKASAEQVREIKTLQQVGIYVDSENARFYPLGALASHVLGFLAPTVNDAVPSGKYGIELEFNDRLSGTDGHIEGDKITRAESGQDLVLTIDPNIQTKSEEILNGLIKKFSAEAGTVIVEDPQTGKILALGNYPTFDPNVYANAELKTFLNPAVQSLYEPGSIFKVITMAAGINSGKITPDTTFVDTGSVTLDSRTIKNWDKKAHGKVTMTEVIEQSINTGAVFAQQKTGKDIFYSYLTKFNFLEPTGIELPGERKGNLGTLQHSFRDINFATAAFGQGVAVTPLQLINAIAVIANGGMLFKTHILADAPTDAIRRVISQDTADKVKTMMISAVDKAEVAHIPGYHVAGKTGTAQIPDFVHGGYLENYIHTYVGFAPASNPKFIVLLKLDKPNATLAGTTVVPAFRELAEFLLNYYNVAPDNLATSN